MENEKPEPPDSELYALPSGSATAPAAPPMGWSFWAVMALVGVLILLIIYAQIQGVTRPVAVNLTGTSWTLASYSDAERIMVTVQGEPVTNISFGPAGMENISGYAGCAWYTYTYTRSNATAFYFTNKTVVQSSCGGDGGFPAESAYLNDLDYTSTIYFRNGYLTFSDVSGKPVLVFRQAPG